MKQAINLALLIGFSICYLEWPPDNSMFIFMAEYEIFANQKNWVSNFTHPIIIVGLVAQLILLYCVFNKNASYKINSIGIWLLTPIVLLFFVVGLLSLNAKIALSTLPYLIMVMLYFWNRKQNKKTASV